jgi:hypothetical protein
MFLGSMFFSLFHLNKICEILINFVLEECLGNVMLKNECGRILWSQIMCGKIERNEC